MRDVVVKAEGARLAGEASAQRVDLVLLHAGGETRGVWRPVMEQLARSGLGAVAYDQRGHGRSGGSVDDGLEAFAEDARRILRAHPEATLVAGASLGGLAAILALTDSDLQSRLGGLALVDVVPAPNPERARRYLAAQGQRVARSPLVEDILSKSDQIRAAASQLSLPLLLVRAGGDGPLTNDDVFALKASCPQLRLAHVERAGHLIARDAPGDLADRLLDFEQSQAVRRRRRATADCCG